MAARLEWTRAATDVARGREPRAAHAPRRDHRNLEAVLDGVYPADPAHLTPILDETRVMARLIDDLADDLAIGGRQLALHPEPTDPDLLIGEVRAPYPRARRRREP